MFTLDHDLYHCTAWKHDIQNIAGKQYDICVSDVVPANKAGSLIQYHILIKIDNRVARLSQIVEGHLNGAEGFECQIKKLAQAFFEFKNTLENNNIRIWYYPEPGQENISSDPPLRMIVTIANTIPNRTKQFDFQKTLQACVWNWVAGP